jgi:hypothetical protein
MAIPYSEYDPFYLKIQIAAELLLTFELLIIVGFLIQRLIERKKPEIKYLIGVMLFLGLGVGFSAVPMILCLWAPQIELVYGVPLFIGELRLWWSNVSYLLMTTSCFFLMCFTHIVFKKLSSRTLWIYLILDIGFNIWSIYYGIFVYQPQQASLTTIMAVYFLFLALFSWGTLFHYARLDAKKLDPSIFKTGLYLVGYSALFTFIGYLIWAVSMITKTTQQLGPMIWFLNCFTGFLLYLGYTLPNWFKKLLSKKYPDLT